MDFPENPVFATGYDAGYQADPPVYPPPGMLIHDVRIWLRGYDQGRLAWGVDQRQLRIDLEPKG